MIDLLKSSLFAALISSLFSAIAVLLHSWNEPFGLFLALLVMILMMRLVKERDRLHISSPNALAQRVPSIVAALVWFGIASIAGSEGNGSEILIEADTIGSSFVVGASAFVALALVSRSRTT